MKTEEESNGRGVAGSLTALIGAGLAAYCSWTLHQSPIWMAVHAVFGWAYMLYLCFGCGGGLPPEAWGGP